MLRIIIRTWQLQFCLLMLFLFCYYLTGPTDGPIWFSLIAVTILALTIAGMIIRRRQRSR
jgi:LPXTG-motif cell wall-anchored protein